MKTVATERNITIFDECTSDFRQTFGGLYQIYGVEPDMAIYGKHWEMEYAITAVVGKTEIMEAAQKTFISSYILDRTNRSCGSYCQFEGDGAYSFLGYYHPNRKRDQTTLADSS